MNMNNRAVRGVVLLITIIINYWRPALPTRENRVYYLYHTTIITPHYQRSKRRRAVPIKAINIHACVELLIRSYSLQCVCV